jgi:hypothetical protein
MDRSIEAEVGKRLNGTLCCAACCLLYARVRSQRIVSFGLFGCAVRLERGLCTCACICFCAHAQLAVLLAARRQAVLRCTAAGAFWAIGLTEFLVAFRGVGLAEARGEWHSVLEYLSMCRRD